MNNRILDLKGLVTAVTTPFDRANRVDTGALREHLQFLWQSGCRNILVSGTTGEFFSLESQEKALVLHTARVCFPGAIMFHAGADALGTTLQLVEIGCDAGADCIASLPPWYLTGVSEEGLIGYFQKVSAACQVPFLIYNFPKHTRSDLSRELLSRVPHWGIKDSSGRLPLIPHTPRYFIGSDRAMLESHRSGGTGFVSARSNCEPALYVQIDAAMQTGDETQAQTLHAEILRITEALDGPGQISLIKQRIAALLPGYPVGVRLPLIDSPSSPKERNP